MATMAAVARPAIAQPPTPPALGARAAVVYAPATGQTLLAVDPDREVPIASTTKLMTALVVLQHVHDLGETLTYPDYHQASTDSQIGLVPGERMTVHDLLIAMMLPSADDAAQDLAFNVGHGSVSRFVAMMNAQARRLGLRHTHYSTPIGLDTAGNYSSASDLVRLADYDLTHFPFLARVVDMPDASLTTGPDHEVTNLNDLVRDYSWINGVKTGHTSGAGYVLVASGERHGMRLISAVLGTDSSAARDSASLAALDYGFDNFGPRTPLRAQQIVARPTVKDRPGLHVPVRAARSFTRIFAHSARIRIKVKVPHRLAGPLPAGTVVGTALVVSGGRTLDRVPVVLDRRLAAVSRLTLAGRFVTQTGTLVVIIVLASLLLVALGLRAARRNPAPPRPRPRRARRART
jgi:D-alanyl-D-alanine carboxypeptidase (penicillin-binding protein 5/6)